MSMNLQMANRAMTPHMQTILIQAGTSAFMNLYYIMAATGEAGRFGLTTTQLLMYTPTILISTFLTRALKQDIIFINILILHLLHLKQIIMESQLMELMPYCLDWVRYT